MSAKSATAHWGVFNKFNDGKKKLENDILRQKQLIFHGVNKIKLTSLDF